MSDARKEPALGRAGDDSAQIQAHLNEKKERLQDELADLLLGVPEDQLDCAALDALLDKLEAVEPMREILDVEESFEIFRQKYGTVLSSMEANPAAISKPSPEKKHPKHTLFKFIPIAAVLILLLGSVSAQAFGLDIFGAIARWTSEIFQLGDNSVPYAEITKAPLAEGEETAYDSLRDAVEAFGITAPVAPTWVPERFTLTAVTAANQLDRILIFADYESDDGYFQIRYKQVPLSDVSSLEIGDDQVTIHTKNNIRHYLLSDMDRHKAFWQNGELECQMFGDVSGQEMEEIIDSIYKGE